MKFGLAATLCGTFVALGTFEVTAVVREQFPSRNRGGKSLGRDKEKTRLGSSGIYYKAILKDEDVYWAPRLMAESMSMTLTPPPTPTPPTPTPPPTPTSPKPPLEECIVNVTVLCADAAGTECNDIEAPPGQCAVGTEINTVRFKYTESSCERGEGDLNSQSDFMCKDTNGGPPTGQPVLISCSYGDTLLAFSRVMMPGDEMTVPSGTDVTGPLPTSIRCIVTSTDGITEYQEVTVETSGDTDLFLKDKFGSLQLESCDENECLMTVNYFYTLENVGTTPMTITVADRERDGDVKDLLESVPDKKLGVGNKTTITEMEQVDVCVDNKSLTMVEVGANPPTGSACFARAEYILIAEAECRVEAEISCIAGKGIDCDKLVPPTNLEECFVPANYSYIMRNTGTTNMIVISASLTINDSDPVGILGFFSTTELTPGAEVVIKQLTTIDACSIEESQIIFKVSAKGDNEKKCNDTDVYVLNPETGPTPPTPPLPPIMPTPSEPSALTPSEPTIAPVPTISPAPSPAPSITPTISPAPTTTSAPTSSPAPSVDPDTSACTLEASIDCKVIEGFAKSCDDLTAPRTQCLSAPTRLDFTFTGDSCIESKNNATNFQCMDDEGFADRTSAYIVIASDNATFFEGVVGLGKTISINGAFSDGVTVTIQSVEAGGAGDDTLQVMKIGTACTDEDDLTLLNTFGALQLVAYENAGGLESVFVSIMITYVVDNISIAANVTSAIAISSTTGSQDFAPFDIGYLETRTFPADTIFINLALQPSFSFKFDVKGEGAKSGIDCDSTATLNLGPPGSTPSKPTWSQPTPSEPTPSEPTSSPAPSVDPDASACTLEASIDCKVIQGSTESCDDLSAPRTQCLSAPTRLDFTFTGDSCIESKNNATNFQCLDDEGIADRTSAYIVIASDNATFFEGVVGLGKTISINGAFSDDVTVTIQSVEAGGAGDDTLQVMKIGTACTDEDDLTLLNTFGALQLVAYENAGGLESVFVSVMITYIVDNISVAANVTSAVATSSTAGSQDFAPFDIGYQETKIIPADEIFINLAENSSYKFKFDVIGEGAKSGMGCNYTMTLDLTVGT